MVSARLGTTRALRELAARHEAEGITAAWAASQVGVSVECASKLLLQAVHKHSMHRVRGAEGRWLYFAQREHALRYAERTGLAYDERPPRVRAPLERQPRRGTGAALQPPTVLPVCGPAHLPGEPVITEHTRIVRAAAPVDARYAPDRRERVVDAAQCRDWAKHAMREVAA